MRNSNMLGFDVAGILLGLVVALVVLSVFAVAIVRSDRVLSEGRRFCEKQGGKFWERKEGSIACVENGILHYYRKE